MKKQYLTIFLIGFFSFIYTNTFSKPITDKVFDGINKDYEVQYNKAMKLVLADEYKEALPILQALKNINPENTNIDFHLGVCKYYLMFDKTPALECFNTAVKSIDEKYENTPGQSKAPLEAIYFQALCNQCLGNYSTAKTLYETYIEKAKTQKCDKKYVKDAKRKIYLCQHPNFVYSTEDEKFITEQRTKIPKNKQNFIYKSRLSKAIEVMNEDYIEGLIAFKEMAKDYPNDPNVNHFLGICILNYTPLRQTSLDYFNTAEKNIIAPQTAQGLSCPTMNQYYMAVAYQMLGNHKEAVLHFENVEKVYPKKFMAFKPDFQEKLDYSRRFLKTGTDIVYVDSNNVLVIDSAKIATINTNNIKLNKYRNNIEFKVKKDLHVIYPETKPRIKESYNSNTTASTTMVVNEIYYTIQIGAGKMREDYFELAPDYRIFKYKVSGVNRYFVGKYTNKQDAVVKLKELKSAGYKDAFITQFKGKIN